MREIVDVGFDTADVWKEEITDHQDAVVHTVQEASFRPSLLAVRTFRAKHPAQDLQGGVERGPQALWHNVPIPCSRGDYACFCACHIEREREAFYIRVPSPAGLIGWNIQYIPNCSLFNAAACLTKALLPMGS